MEIKRVTIHQYEIPLEEPFVTVLRPIPELRRLVVEIETDDGIVGIGEGSPSYTVTGETQRSTKAVLEDVLAPLIIGKDPLALERLTTEMRDLVAGSPGAHAAIEIALHDLRGQVAGLPLYKLFGGYSESSVLEVPKVLSIKDADEMARDAMNAVEAGYSQLKIKVGHDPNEDQERVRAIADAVPESVSLKADANQGWGDAKTALRALSGMSNHLDVIEQPVHKDSISDLAIVRENTMIPVMADESVRTASDAHQLIRQDAADYYNIKLMKTGGLSEAIRLALVAEAAGRQTQLGSMVEGQIATAAGVHFALAFENVVWNEMVGPFMTTTGVTDLAFNEPKIDVDGPGLGITLDRDKLADLRRDHVMIE